MSQYGTWYQNLNKKKKKKKKVETFPVGDDLTGFESLTSGQQNVNQALIDALTGGLGGAPSFEYPGFEYPAPPSFPALPAPPPVPNLTNVGNLPDMLASLNELMPGMSPEVQETLNTLMQGAGAQPQQTLEEIIASIPTFGGELGAETQSALAQALSGKFPEEYFQASIAGPARERFTEETAPAIREEFAGPGTFWGTARAGAVTKEQGKMEGNLAAIRGELGHQAQERALQATVVSINARQNQIQMAIQELAGQRNFANAQQVTALNAAIAEMENQQNSIIAAQNELNRLSQGAYQEAMLGQQAWQTSLQGQLQQQAQQQQGYQQAQAQAQQLYTTEMQTAYDNYIRQNPDMAQSLQAALNYLNIPIMTTYQEYDETAGAGNALVSRLGG